MPNDPCPICQSPSATPCCSAVQTLTGCCGMVEALKKLVLEYQALADREYLSKDRRELDTKASKLFIMAEHLSRTHAGLRGR